MKTGLIALGFLLYFFIINTNAQNTGFLSQLPEEEQNAIEAIAIYPQKERAAVLEASLYPEVLVRMDLIRKNTETKFKEMISGLSQEAQKKIYNLSRYPDLLKQIAEREKSMSTQEMNDVLKNYPEEISADALFANQQYFDLLRKINSLYADAEISSKTILSTYPPNAQEAYSQLTRLPAVITILTNNMNMTVLLGDIYKQHPEQLWKELDSLNLVIAQQQAKDLKEWKQQLDEDPQAMSEYEQAAKEFAKEEGYDDKYYDGPMPERYREEIYVHDVWRPYSYWFGWPSWYAYECWYPYPWWYHWGYYYGPSNVIIIVGMPSNVFIHWQFFHHKNLYHYPHFTDHVIRHYYGPRHFGATVQPVLRNWEEANRQELPSNWFQDDRNRADRIKEFGKFKMDYEDKVRKSTDKTPTEREFLKDNADRYPTLKPVLQEKPDEPKTKKEYTRDNKPGKETRPDQYKPKEKIIEPQKEPRQEEIDRAKENHENAWDRVRKNPNEQSPPPQAPPQRKDQPKAQPRPEPPKRDQVQPPRTPPERREPTRSPSKQTEPGKREKGGN